MTSEQMREEVGKLIGAATNTVQAVGIPRQAEWAMLAAILTGELTALVERATRETLEQYMSVGPEDVPSEEEIAEVTQLNLTNEKGQAPKLGIGTDAAGGLVFSPPPKG